MRSHYRFILALCTTLAFLSCERKSEVTVSDTTSTSSVAVPPETTTVVHHDTVVAQPIVIDSVSVKRPPAQTKPNITVEYPVPGQHVTGPIFAVHGTARTFENSVSFKFVSASGAVLSSGHTLARGSMGEFGPYDFQVSTGDYVGKATLQVFDNSAKDGREIDKVSVPVDVGQDTIGLRSSDRLPGKRK